MDIANRISNESHAVRLKVGAVIVKDGNIISFGYNGTPPGWDNCCEYADGDQIKTKPEVLHAEMNSLLKLAREGGNGRDAEMFCTHSPCIECAKAIATVGISKFYYRYEYRRDEGIEFLKKFGVEVEQVS